MIFTVISFIGLVVLYFCCNFGSLKGKLFSLKQNIHTIIVDHCIDLIIIIALIIILFILWVLEAILGKHWFFNIHNIYYISCLFLHLYIFYSFEISSCSHFLFTHFGSFYGISIFRRLIIIIIFKINYDIVEFSLLQLLVILVFWCNGN